MKIVAVPAWVTATNAYLAYDEATKVAVLVDAPPEPDRIGDVAVSLGVTIGALLLTHGHIDHTGGAGEIQSRFGTRVYVHPDDDFLTLHPQEQLRRIFGMEPPGSYDLPRQLTDLTDGMKLDLGGFTFETRQTPGHTPGHCCFYVEDEGVLFSGDQLFAGSIGRTDLPGGSAAELFTSMRERVMTLDDETRVLPGHGPETSIGRERATNPFRAEWS
ncbi:MAG: MBL fold metallo-hydrolase [Acidimicrobiia bacterium]|nr:MBL fold metallo-hydrolase [Acidimicrobiia bacterium]MDH3462790.1 MBL fold metallo-hydrolase [Acidimicrobiia bacterium]